jgi:hypothetical protein
MFSHICSQVCGYTHRKEGMMNINKLGQQIPFTGTVPKVAAQATQAVAQNLAQQAAPIMSSLSNLLVQIAKSIRL